MSFVFYNLETSGNSQGFDQIVGFAAIRTDSALEEIARFEGRCALYDHILPHPDALCSSRRTIQEMRDRSLPSHYDLMREVRSVLTLWSPSLFVGFNSFRFDEGFLRHAFFQTLHPPYLTNTSGNCRADLLLLARASSVFEPDCLLFSKNVRGNPSFELHDIARANGLDSLRVGPSGNVNAILHIARRLANGAPDAWNRLIRFANKASVTDFVENEDAFFLTEFYSNRPYHYVVAPIGRDPDQHNTVLCLDLTVSLDSVRSRTDSQLFEFVRQSPKPLRRIRLNAPPVMTPLDEVSWPQLIPLTAAEVTHRATQLRKDFESKCRLLDAAKGATTARATSDHAEDQLYDRFVEKMDEARMTEFHEADWQQRADIVEQFDDPRLRVFGRRLLFLHARTVLAREHATSIERELVARTHDASENDGKWLSLPAAQRLIAERMPRVTDENRKILQGYREFLLQGGHTPTRPSKAHLSPSARPTSI
jgi:exodeoxyribonuclease-1